MNTSETKKPLRIAVLNGGPGSEREISLRSGECVTQALRERGHSVERIDVRDAGFPLPPDLAIAVNMVHGVFGEDGELQAILEKRGVPYTGEGVEGSRRAFDKILSKAAFEAAGVETPRYEVLQAGPLLQRPSLPLPMVIKAPCEGSSVGVHLVREEAAIEPALVDVARYGDVILVEELVSGRELTVGIVGDLALPVIEIVPKDGFYDFKNKYPWLNPDGAARHFCPAPLTEEEAEQVRTTALRAHAALGLEVYSRVDLLLPPGGPPTVLEINTIPGMTESSLLPEAAAAIGIGFGELCEQIIDLSLRKQPCRNL